MAHNQNIEEYIECVNEVLKIEKGLTFRKPENELEKERKEKIMEDV